MEQEGADKDPGGQQPEFVKGLQAATQAGGKKPEGQTNDATPETAPQPGNLEAEEKRAADILHRNAAADTGRPA